MKWKEILEKQNYSEKGFKNKTSSPHLTARIIPCETAYKVHRENTIYKSLLQTIFVFNNFFSFPKAWQSVSTLEGIVRAQNVFPFHHVYIEK